MNRPVRQAHPAPRRLPPDEARQDLSLVAGAAAILLVIAAVATWLNPAPLPGMWP